LRGGRYFWPPRCNSGFLERFLKRADFHLKREDLIFLLFESGSQHFRFRAKLEVVFPGHGSISQFGLDATKDRGPLEIAKKRRIFDPQAPKSEKGFRDALILAKDI
jgi:hypothetical protein